MINIKSPYTLDQLKTAYREAVKRTHPDYGGKAEDFIAVKKEYAKLILTCSNGSKDLVTEDGTLLSELGLGLGPTVNGKDCPECQHKGYRKSQRGDQEYCPNKIHFNNMFDPFTWRQMRRGPVCALCRDSRFIRTNPRIVYYTCSYCTGTGEIKVFNAALPKGRVYG